jgi:thiol-disulfide isomerase/thioredoxin
MTQMKKRAQCFLVLLFAGLAWCNAAIAEPAPSFPVPTAQGNVPLSELSGSVVYVDFWASWCTPCRKSFPWMNKMQEKYGKLGLIVVGVNVDSERKLADAFLAETPASFPIAYDQEGKLASEYGLVGMPTSFLVDQNGQIAQRHVGFRAEDADEIEAEIKKLLLTGP